MKAFTYIPESPPDLFFPQKAVQQPHVCKGVSSVSPPEEDLMISFIHSREYDPP